MGKPTIAAAAGKWFDEGFGIVPLAGVRDGICTCWKSHECGQPGKHPLMKFKSGSSFTSKLILDHYFQSNPDVNFGAIPGERFVDIETDIKTFMSAGVVRRVQPHAEDCLEYFESLLGVLPVTRSFKSGGGGTHRIFSVTKALGPGQHLGLDMLRKEFDYPELSSTHIDWRAGISYFVAPPSNHKSGVPYTMLELGFQTPIAALPGPWEEFIGSQASAQSTRNADEVFVPESDYMLPVSGKELKACLAHGRGILNKVLGRKPSEKLEAGMVVDGSRDETTFKLVRALLTAGHTVAAVFMVAKAFRDQVYAAGEQRYSNREITVKIGSAMNTDHVQSKLAEAKRKKVYT